MVIQFKLVCGVLEYSGWGARWAFGGTKSYSEVDVVADAKVLLHY